MEANQKEKYYITTAIAYTSRKPHIGNSYEIVLTDAIARFQRSLGKDVYFLTGTDEHGQKIEEYAKAADMSPQAYVDGVANEIRQIADGLNCSYDGFIRTTDPKHVACVQKIFKKFYDQGDIYKADYEGHYCVPCEAFFTDSQLKDGCCPDCGRPVTKAKEEAYFFRMSKYQDRLVEHINSHPDFIFPESRKNEMLNNFILPGVQDLCVSRTSFKWGIPVSFDEKHVIYVWVDALSNYITALGYDPDGSSEQFQKYWPCDCHVIGKDILRFHTIYWPIFLMALGLPLPKQVFGHPWLLAGEDKMSKSKNNVIYADDLAVLFGVDAVRYYLLSEIPYAQDGTITYESMIARYNADLANTLGNLVNRTISMNQKYFGGVLQQPLDQTELDKDLFAAADKAVADFCADMQAFKMAYATDKVMELARRCNKYIDETTPWALAKNEADKPRLGSVLYNLLECIRRIGVLIAPLMPDTAASIFAQLGCAPATLERPLAESALTPGNSTAAPTPLFARIDEKVKAEEIAAMQEKYNKPEATPAQQPEEGFGLIDIADFGKVELRVAKVKFCEPVPKSKKLLRFLMDDGSDTPRQIVSGIAQYYAPEDLIGKQVLIVANLKPAKLCGVESQGMLLAADCGEQVQVLFVGDELPPGSRLR